MKRSLQLKDPKNQLPPLTTPCMVVPCELGLIPHVTPDISPNYPLYFYVGDFLNESLPKNVSIVASLSQTSHWVFVGPAADFNNFDEGPSGDGIKIGKRNGSVEVINKEKYINLVDRINPNGVVSLYSQIFPTSSSRQTKKRMDAANQLINEFHDVLNFQSVYSEPNKAFGQFFHFIDFTEKSLDKIKEVLEKVESDLPNIILFDGHPNDIRKAVSSGIDLFIVTMPILYAKRGYAMTFPLENGENCEELAIDLKSMDYVHQHTPVVEGCSCMCCKKHSRSYIHHLLEVHEMVASTLLVIHNLHHYERLFEQIRAENQ